MLFAVNSILPTPRARILCLALITAFTSLFIVPSANAEGNRVYPGYLVVMNDASATPNMAMASDSAKLATKGFTKIKDLGAPGRLLVDSGSQHYALDEASQQPVEYNPELDKCPSLLKSGLVKACSPNWEVRASALPNDPSLSSLWGLSSSLGVDAPGAWDLTTGSNEVVVAVIDTGVDYTHPDLAANIWVNPWEIPGNGIDDDHNGIVDDVHGANFSKELNPQNSLPKGDPRDNNMHGTHVAGTIGAIGNNSRGVVGINWNVKIMALKFLSSSGSGSLGDAASAINYMVAMKNRGVNIRVANNSWGGGGPSALLYDAIAAARDAGIIFAAAAGNEANDNDASPSYPATYDLSNIVSVAAIDSNQNLASFSNYGRTKVDIAAPGVGITSTVPGNGYASLSGTSMATPHVSGALALLLSHEPNLSADQALTRMYESALPAPGLQDIVRTGRTLNVKRMVYNETAAVEEPRDEVPCHYDIEEIPFNPDQDVMSEPIVQQTDEKDFYNLQLPFQFPFYRSVLSALQVSANGIVYRRAPSGFDYENASRAPLSSIAPLHTDLTGALGENDGVRVRVQQDLAVIYWDEKLYDKPTSGNVKVWLHVYSSGVIEQFVTFGSNELMKAVRSHATVGMSGPSRNSADTYAVNDKRITNGLSLRYTPQCSDESAGDNASVRRVTVTPKGSKAIVPGSKVSIKVGGTGNGTVLMGAAFNGQLCSEQVPGYMSAGHFKMSGRLPSASSFSRFTVFADGKRAGMRVSSASRRAIRSKRLSSVALQTVCAQFFATLK